MSQPPPAPENVRVVLPDGREVPMEPVYVGLLNGIHVWKVAWPFWGIVAALKAGTLPARTTIELTYGNHGPPTADPQDN